jgi:hypothetical protein
MAAINELLGRPLMVADEVGLKIGSLIPVHAQPGEPVKNPLDRICGRPLGIRILDTKDKFTAVLTGVEPVENGSAGTADMKIPCWAGGKTNNNGCHDINPFYRCSGHAFVRRCFRILKIRHKLSDRASNAIQS